MITGDQFIAIIIGFVGSVFAIYVVKHAEKHAEDRDSTRKYVNEWMEVLYGSRKDVRE